MEVIFSQFAVFSCNTKTERVQSTQPSESPKTLQLYTFSHLKKSQTFFFSSYFLLAPIGALNSDNVLLLVHQFCQILSISANISWVYLSFLSVLYFSFFFFSLFFSFFSYFLSFSLLFSLFLSFYFLLSAFTSGHCCCLSCTPISRTLSEVQTVSKWKMPKMLHQNVNHRNLCTKKLLIYHAGIDSTLSEVKSQHLLI